MPDNSQGLSQVDAEAIFRGYITEAEFARQRGVSVRTCQRDRSLRKAPPHVVVGRVVYYRVEAIREWLISQERMAGQRSATGRRARFR